MNLRASQNKITVFAVELASRCGVLGRRTYPRIS